MDKMMFNNRYGLTKSVLSGYKTKTRRLASSIIRQWEISEELGEILGTRQVSLEEFAIRHSRYKVGDVVAVAQSYSDICYSPSIQEELENKLGMCAEDSAGWHNKMFVSADIMPHRIKITSVGFERLHDISEEECLKEGVIRFSDNEYAVEGVSVPYSRVEKGLYVQRIFSTAKDAFSVLMDKTSGKGTWESNPYVYVYGFELVK